MIYVHHLATLHRIPSIHPNLLMYVKRLEGYELDEDEGGHLKTHPELAKTFQGKDLVRMYVLRIADDVVITCNAQRALRLLVARTRREHNEPPYRPGDNYTPADDHRVMRMIIDHARAHLPEIRAILARQPTYHKAPSTSE